MENEVEKKKEEVLNSLLNLHISDILEKYLFSIENGEFPIDAVKFCFASLGLILIERKEIILQQISALKTISNDEPTKLMVAKLEELINKL